MNRQTKELMQANNQLDEKLNDENSRVLTDIICYLRVANISEYHQEIVRQDLLEMILSAQERGEDIETVIGEDYKAFCDNIIANLPHQNIKERIFEIFNIVFLCTAILGIISIITSLFSTNWEIFDFNIVVSVGWLVSYAIIIAVAFVIVQVVGKTSVESGKRVDKSKVMNFFRSFLIGACTMAICLVIAWIGRNAYFTMNIFIACGFVLLMYIIHRFFTRYNN